MSDLLRAIRDSLIEGLSPGREVERIGGFVYLKHPSDDLVWLNQSVPVATVSTEDLITLLGRYRETNREPFFEFFPVLSPEAPQLLEEAGLTKKHEMPIMVLARDAWRPIDVTAIARPCGTADLGGCLSAAAEAFGSDSMGSIEDLGAGIENGRVLAAVAFKDSEVVASGQAVGTARIREIAGIGTRPDWRRRGYAEGVIHSLLAQHFGQGGELAWLTPGDDGAEALYVRCGFRTVGMQAVYGVR